MEVQLTAECPFSHVLRNKRRPAISHTRRSGMLMRAMSFMGVCVKEFQFAALRRPLADAAPPPAVIKDRVLCAADNDFSIRKRTHTMQFD